MENVTEIFEQYLDGDLNQETLQWFHNEMKSNSSFAHQFKTYTEVNEAITETEIINFRKKLHEIYHLNYGTKKPFTRRMLPLLAIAATLLLFAGIAVIVMNKSGRKTETDLFSHYYKPYETLSIVRSEATGADQLIESALNEYTSSNFSNSFDLFMKALGQKPYDSLALFYSALAAIEIEKYNYAILTLQNFSKNKENIFSQQAEWYLGLCYLKKNRSDSAIILFQSIVKQGGYNSQQAKEILEYYKE